MNPQAIKAVLAELGDRRLLDDVDSDLHVEIGEAVARAALAAAPVPPVVGEDAVERACEIMQEHLEIDFDGDEPYVRSDSIDAAVRAALASSVPVGVKVKALEWEESAGNCEGQTVWSPKANIWPCWIVKNPDNNCFVWCEEIGITFAPASPVMGVFDTLEAAKAAAQADYERRILSSLSPAQGWREPCATEGCDKPASVHFIRGDIGSYYCHDCYLKVQALPSAPVGGRDAE